MTHDQYKHFKELLKKALENIKIARDVINIKKLDQLTPEERAKIENIIQ
jgi:hypothetical protein